MGSHPVAVVILHVHGYGNKKVTREFKSGGQHEKHKGLLIIQIVRSRHK
jgi:hypothetical protein